MIFAELAKKMGLKGFDWKDGKDVWDDMRACTPSMLGATYEKMEKPESVHWPCPTVEHPGTPILHKEKFSAADGLGTFFGLEYRPPFPYGYLISDIFQPLVHFIQLRSHFLAVGLPSYLEESVSRLIHVMGEAKEIECPRLHAMAFRIRSGKPPELDQSRLVQV